MPILANIHKIAVLNAKAVGEFMFIVPALLGLRTAYPDAEIVLVGKPWQKRFFDRRPGPIDRTIVMPFIEGLVLTGEQFAPAEHIETFKADMRAESFDLAMQLHGPGGHANPYVAALGASVSAGCHGENADFRLERSIPYLSTQNEVIRWLEVINQVGGDTSYWEPNVPVTDEDELLASTFLPGQSTRYAAINAGALFPRRRWSESGFVQVAHELDKEGLTIVLVGTGEDESLATSISRSLQHSPINLTGKLTERALAGVLHRCKLVVGNDSDALRLAWALNVPTVGISWCGSTTNFDPLRRQLHRRVISWQTTCPACGVDVTHGGCSHEDSLVTSVSKDEVLRQALMVLKSIQ